MEVWKGGGSLMECKLCTPSVSQTPLLLRNWGLRWVWHYYETKKKRQGDQVSKSINKKPKITVLGLQANQNEGNNIVSTSSSSGSSRATETDSLFGLAAGCSQSPSVP